MCLALSVSQFSKVKGMCVSASVLALGVGSRSDCLWHWGERDKMPRSDSLLLKTSQVSSEKEGENRLGRKRGRMLSQSEGNLRLPLGKMGQLKMIPK